jgi:S-adenosylmethionine:tRNA ribosyltransferase-isomerase
MHPKELSIASFTYALPNDRIAQHPLAKRDASKLLVYRDGKIVDETFSNIATHLPADSLIVFNTTRVVRARLQLQRSTGAAIEVFCTDAADTSKDFAYTLQQQKEVVITAFVGNAKRWKNDEVLELHHETFTLRATKIAPVHDQWHIHLTWTPETLSFAEILEQLGKIPLPPYMTREEEADDNERYQTIFAKTNGSVAAPTAGLHFSEEVITSINEKQITTGNVTLHVGAGTFKPVKSETMDNHEMHREQIIVHRDLIELLLHHNKNGITAVGTTALRTLESIYWFGRQLVLQPGQFRSTLFVGQWEPYEGGPDVPVPVALRAIAEWMREYNMKEVSGYTQVLIAPGYRFRIVNRLVTNFHQPQSTLLLLVAAFIGDDYRKVYEHALQHNYRFLSYGDSSLLWRND